MLVKENILCPNCEEILIDKNEKAEADIGDVFGCGDCGVDFEVIATTPNLEFSEIDYEEEAEDEEIDTEDDEEDPEIGF